jgi:hypothetical protein
MPLSYAYELIAQRSAVGPLLRAFARHLAPDDQQRLIAAVDTGECEVLRHIARREDEQHSGLFDQGGGDVCFVFHFAPDAELVEYARETNVAPAQGRIQVGCVWTSLKCGDQFLVLRAGPGAFAKLSLRSAGSAEPRSCCSTTSRTSSIASGSTASGLTPAD